MKKIITVIVILVVLGGIAAYYLLQKSDGDSYQSESGEYAESATPTPIGAPASVTPTIGNTRPTITPRSSATPTPRPTTAASVTVDIRNFAFSPTTLTIKVGTKVTWTNNDTGPHTVTSDTGSLLNSPSLSNGQAFNFTFNAPGSFDYHCAIHPMMKGRIVVTN